MPIDPAVRLWGARFFPALRYGCVRAFFSQTPIFQKAIGYSFVLERTRGPLARFPPLLSKKKQPQEPRKGPSFLVHFRIHLLVRARLPRSFAKKESKRKGPGSGDFALRTLPSRPSARPSTCVHCSLNRTRETHRRVRSRNPLAERETDTTTQQLQPRSAP